MKNIKFIIFIYLSHLILYEETKKKILIYGSFYNRTLLRKLDKNKCPNGKNYKITRKGDTIDFDIVILHFTKHNEFIRKYLTYNITKKRIMIIHVFVFYFLK